MPNNPKRHLVFDWVRAVIWALVMVAVVILGSSSFFGKYSDRFWLAWELAAVGASAAYTAIVFSVDMLLFPPYISKLISPPRVWWCEVLGALVGPGLLLTAFFLAVEVSWLVEMPFIVDLLWWHVLCLTVGIFLIFCAHVVVVTAPLDDPSNKTDSQKKEHKHLVEDTQKTLIYCDGPTVLALLILFVFIWISDTGSIEEQETIKNWQAFIGGAIAFQFLLSNAVFGLRFVGRLMFHSKTT